MNIIQACDVNPEIYQKLKDIAFNLSTLSGVSYDESKGYNLDMTLTRATEYEVGRFIMIGRCVRVAYSELPHTSYESLLIQCVERGYTAEVTQQFMYGSQAALTIVGGALRYARLRVDLPLAKEKIPQAPSRFGYDPNGQDFLDWEYELTGERDMNNVDCHLLMREIHTIAELD